MRDSTGSPDLFAVRLVGRSAGCTASIVSFSGAIGGIIGLSGRGRGYICTTTDTVFVTLSSAGIGCGISGSYIWSAISNISRWTIDLRGAIIATASVDRGISGILGGVGTVT